jgi:hypothetical protein
MPVALVGPPTPGVVKAQFLLERDNQKNAEAISDAEKEIQYYLFELREPDPWAYAQYHCGTTSNALSTVHWSFVKPDKTVVLTRKRRESTKKAATNRKR